MQAGLPPRNSHQEVAESQNKLIAGALISHGLPSVAERCLLEGWDIQFLEDLSFKSMYQFTQLQAEEDCTTFAKFMLAYNLGSMAAQDRITTTFHTRAKSIAKPHARAQGAFDWVRKAKSLVMKPYVPLDDNDF